MASVNFADMSGDPVLQSVAEGNSEGNEDGAGTPMSMEAELIEGAAAIIAPPAPWLEREYVWGPGGGNGGIDELLVQYDAQRRPWWVVQDEGGDVVALCDLGAANADGRVVAQFTYDAYGSPLSYDNLANHPLMHCGHKGLFVDRLDVGVASAGGIEIPRLVPYAHLLVHNRNRTYIPQMGRFLQADPNATAMTLLAASSHHGRGMDAIVAAFDMQDMYGDGANLYQYLGSNPWRRHDVLGLSWDPFSMVDDFLAEHTGSVSAMMERLVGMAKTVAFVGAMIASQLPFPITSILGDAAAEALEGGVAPELIAARKMLGQANLAMLGVMAAKIGLSAAKAALHYVAKHGFVGTVRNLWNGAKSLARGAWNWLKRKEDRAGTCNLCFTGAMVVWTVAGQVPIEHIRVGDYVLATDEASGGLRFAPVTATIETPDASLLDVTVRQPNGELELIRTTDEHPFWVERSVNPDRPSKQLGRGWKRADQLFPGDELATVIGSSTVVSLSFTTERSIVFNLTIKDLGTYHVGSDGILVHNCQLFVSEALPRHMLTRRPLERGKPPRGRDGELVELHHPDSSKPMEVREILMTNHRGPGQKGLNHPDPWVGMSDADRAAYNAARKKYWAEQWDLGRFNGLPE